MSDDAVNTSGAPDPQRNAHPDAPTSITPSLVPSSDSSLQHGPVAHDDQKTVISKRAPLVEPQFRHGVNPQELGSMLEGESLGYFRLEEFVGGGGMGAVFRAADTMLGRTVAVKVLSRDQTDEDTLRRFRNEAQSAARLDHDNIARVYYVGDDKGVNYIVFEFIEGVNIRDLVIQKGPLPVDEAINYAIQVAEALEHAHQRDVVHRDIKPSNILVTPEGRAKLVDMGLARLHHVESNSEDITASGVTLGTFDYISPEQAREPRSADVRSDIYSLGCTFYFMLTGQAPFPEGTVLQKLLSHSTDDPPNPADIREDLDERTTSILAKMMAKQPSARYQEPSDLIRDLVALANSLGVIITRRGTSMSASKTTPRLSRLKRHIPWLLPVSTLAAAMIYLWMVWQTPTSLPPDRVNLPKPVAVSPLHEPRPSPSGQADRKPDDGTQPDSSTVADGPTEPSPPDDNEDPKNVAPGDAADRTAEREDAPRVPAMQESVELQAASDVSERIAAVSDEHAHLPATSGYETPERPTAPSPTANVVVVGNVAAPAAGAESVATLEMAIKRVEAEPRIQQIELHFDGPRRIQPLDLVADDLTIKAGQGYRPELVFRPDVDSLGTADAAMMRVLGGSVRWQNVQFRLEVPEEWIDTWALFRLEHVERISMTDCVLTVRNLHRDGSVFHDRVAFFDVPTGLAVAPADSMDPSSDDSARTEIRLQRCLARGQATFVRLGKGKAVWLVWEQGLLATTERLFESRGMARAPEDNDARINLDMTNVTVVARRGIGQMMISDKLPYHRELVANWVDCIAITDGDAALYEQDGSDGKGDNSERIVNELMQRISIRGRDSIYPNSSFILRVIPTSSPGETLNYLPEDRKDFDRWYDEMQAEFGIRVTWKSTATSNLSLDQHTKHDYVPQFPSTFSRENMPGFTLPSMPEAALAPGLDENR